MEAEKEAKAQEMVDEHGGKLYVYLSEGLLKVTFLAYGLRGKQLLLRTLMLSLLTSYYKVNLWTGLFST